MIDRHCADGQAPCRHARTGSTGGWQRDVVWPFDRGYRRGIRTEAGHTVAFVRRRPGERVNSSTRFFKRVAATEEAILNGSSRDHGRRRDDHAAMSCRSMRHPDPACAWPDSRKRCAVARPLRDVSRLDSARWPSPCWTAPASAHVDSDISHQAAVVTLDHSHPVGPVEVRLASTRKLSSIANAVWPPAPVCRRLPRRRLAAKSFPLLPGLASILTRSGRLPFSVRKARRRSAVVNWDLIADELITAYRGSNGVTIAADLSVTS